MPVQRYSAEKEYQKNTKISKDVVQKILEWTKTQPHLPAIQEEDVIIFLTACLYSIEVTKQTIDHYYTYRTHIPELFSKRDTTVKLNALNKALSTFAVLPGLTEDGCKVIYIQQLTDDLSSFDLASDLRMMLFSQDNVLYEEGAQLGLKILYNMEGSSATLISRLSPSLLKKIADYLLKASPTRLLSLHIINPTSFTSLFVKLLTSLMGSIVHDTLKIHNDMADLYKAFPKSMLPAEVGGDLESCREISDQYKNRIIANRDFFIAEEKLRVQESLRPGKAKTAADIFGLEGSFRKLDLD